MNTTKFRFWDILIALLVCIICIICIIINIKINDSKDANSVNRINIKNMYRDNLKLNEKLKSKGTPESFIETMPFTMKEDIIKNGGQFVKCDKLLNSNKDKTSKNFNSYVAIYSLLIDNNQKAYYIYVYYKWTDIPLVLKYKNDLTICWDGDSLIDTVDGWCECHTTYKDNKPKKLFENTNIKTLMSGRAEWATLMSNFDILSVIGNKYIDGFRRIIIKKYRYNQKSDKINIKYVHYPGMKCNSTLTL